MTVTDMKRFRSFKNKIWQICSCGWSYNQIYLLKSKDSNIQGTEAKGTYKFIGKWNFLQERSFISLANLSLWVLNTPENTCWYKYQPQDRSHEALPAPFQLRRIPWIVMDYCDFHILKKANLSFILLIINLLILDTYFLILDSRLSRPQPRISFEIPVGQIKFQLQVCPVWAVYHLSILNSTGAWTSICASFLDSSADSRFAKRASLSFSPLTSSMFPYIPSIVS